MHGTGPIQAWCAKEEHKESPLCRRRFGARLFGAPRGEMMAGGGMTGVMATARQRWMAQRAARMARDGSATPMSGGQDVPSGDASGRYSRAPLRPAAERTAHPRSTMPGSAGYRGAAGRRDPSAYSAARAAAHADRLQLIADLKAANAEFCADVANKEHIVCKAQARFRQRMTARGVQSTGAATSMTTSSGTSGATSRTQTQHRHA